MTSLRELDAAIRCARATVLELGALGAAATPWTDRELSVAKVRLSTLEAVRARMDEARRCVDVQKVSP